MTNRDSPYFIGEASPTRSPCVTYVPATPSRFARTLREVIADDYMPEIEGLKRRLSVIETELPKLRFRAGPPSNPIPQMHPTTDEQANMVQYLSTDDDDRIADVMRHCNEQFYDVNSHLNEIDDALSDFVNSIGVCLLLTLSLCQQYRGLSSSHSIYLPTCTTNNKPLHHKKLSFVSLEIPCVALTMLSYLHSSIFITIR